MKARPYVLLYASIVMGSLPVVSLATEARLVRMVLVDRPASWTDQALTLLGVPHRTLEARADLQKLLAYDLIVLGQDVTRRFRPAAVAQFKTFVEQGGAILAFEERSGADAWLPTPVKKDLTHRTSTIAVPEHPLFTYPHRIVAADLDRVHGASA
jgi:hypothetical protein